MKPKKKKRKNKGIELIRLLCSCGKRVKVSHRFAGKEGKCPKCGNTVKIPPLSVIQKKVNEIKGDNIQQEVIEFPSLPELQEIDLASDKKPILQIGNEDALETTGELEDFYSSGMQSEFVNEINDEHHENNLDRESDNEVKEEESVTIEEGEDVEEALTIGEGEDIEEAVTIEGGEDIEEAVTIEESEDIEEAVTIEESEDIEDAVTIEEGEDIEDAVTIEEGEDIEEAVTIEEIDDVEEADDLVDAEQFESLDSNIMAVDKTTDFVEAIPISKASSKNKKEVMLTLNTAEFEKNISGGELLAKAKNSLEKSDFDSALQFSSELINKKENLGAAYCLRSLIYIKKGYFEIAIEDLERAKVLNYNEIDFESLLDQVFLMLSIKYRKLNAYDEALNYLNKIVNSDITAEKGKIYWLRAKTLIKKGAYDTALRDIEDAILNHYIEAEIFETRGQIYLEQRDYESAMHDFSTAINRGAEKSTTFKNRSKAYLLMGKLDLALGDVKMAQNLDFEDLDLYDIEGVILNEQKKYRQADEIFYKVLDLDPNNTNHYFNHAICYMRRGRFDRAIENFSRVIQKNPKDRLAYLKRAICFQEKRNPDLALARENFQKVDQLEPNAFCRFNSKK